MTMRLASATTAALILALGACGAPSSGSSSASGGTAGGGTSGGTSGGGTSGGTSGGQVGDGGRDNTCEFALNPSGTGILTGASIKASVFAKCATAPQRHHMEVHLQRVVSGQWNDMNWRQWDDIPGAQAIIPKLVTAPCVPGSWRVTVHVEGASASGMPFTLDHTGDVKEVKPSDCG